MKKKIFLVTLIAVFVATVFFTTRFYAVEEVEAAVYEGDAVVFSLDKLSYSGEQMLELSVVGESGFIEGQIRYTTDGSEPTTDSELYTGAIPLEIIEGRACHTIRAAVFEGEKQSKVYTRSYFVGGEAALDNGEYVVSVTADPDDFYGIMGIFYGPEDITEEEFAKDDLIINYKQTGREWEKRANIEIYNSAGNLMLSQLSGVRISGNWSRIFDVKSLRFYARSEYDATKTRFDCGFLNMGAQPNGLDIASFNQIDLRNGGNRWVDTMLNDVYVRKMAAQAGYEPVGESYPAAVYLNGEWYGFMWLQPSYCEKNIEEMLGLPNSEDVKVINGSEWAMEGDEADMKNYLDMCSAIKKMETDEDAAMIEEILDVDNALMQYVFGIYFCNTDWIINNMKMWRFIGEEEPGNKYTDGRWRYIVYDYDHTLGQGIPVEQYTEVFEWAFGERQASKVLVALINNAGFRSRFINIWCDLFATTMSAENALAVLEETIALTTSELEYREQTQPDKFNTSERLAAYDIYRDFLANRENYIRDGLDRYLDVQGLYELEVKNTDSNAEIIMNSGYVTLKPGQNLSGNYYTDNPCIINANYDDGYEFGHWLVNGRKIESETLALDEDTVGTDQSISVSLVTKQTQNAEPIITKISYRGADDWVEITNPGTEPIDLSSYYLSDRADNPNKYMFPAIMLEAGESVTIYSNVNIYAPLGAYQFGFKLAQYETLFLTGHNETLEEVYMPNSKEGYIYERRPFARGWQYAYYQR